MTFQNIDYDNYIEKHFARYYGWLPASKTFKNEIGGKAVKYFTLCAKQALDIFMLEKENILQRDGNKNLPNVIICEGIPKDAVEIFNIVRPPLKEAIIVDELEKLLTYEDNDEIRALLLRGQDAKFSKPERNKLDRREKAIRLKDAFPFDIINFDPCGNFFSPQLGQNELYQAFKKVFELQRAIQTFLLFVTTPFSSINSETETQIRNNFDSNVSGNTQISTALNSSLGTTDYSQIEEGKRIAICFTKSIVIPAAIGWKHKHHGIFIYVSPHNTKILSSVIQFSKKSNPSDNSHYLDDLINIIKIMPTCYSSDQSAAIKTHLDEIKIFREQSRTNN